MCFIEVSSTIRFQAFSIFLLMKNTARVTLGRYRMLKCTFPNFITLSAVLSVMIPTFCFASKKMLITPSCLVAILNLASDLLASGDPSEAFEYFQDMASSTGSYRELGHLGLSICYERMGELESAVAELDEELWVERRGRLISRVTASGR